MKVTSVARAPARVPFKKSAGRFVRKHTKSYSVRMDRLRSVIQGKHEQMIIGGASYSDVALAEQVDNANPTPILTALSPSNIFLSTSIIGTLVTMGALNFAFDLSDFSGFVGIGFATPFVFSYAASMFVGMKKVASIHNPETLYALARGKISYDNPSASVINYIRGVIKQPGHEDIKEGFLEKILKDRVLKEPHKSSLAILVVAFYDLFSPEQKQRLMMIESGETSTFNVYEPDQSVLTLFLDAYKTPFAFDLSFIGNQDVILENLHNFLKDFLVYKKEGAPGGAADLAISIWKIDDFNMNVVVSALLQNEHFDSDEMIRVLVESLDEYTLTSNMLGTDSAADKFIDVITGFAIELSEQGVSDKNVRCFVKSVFQKVASGYIGRFCLGKTYREPGVLDQSIKRLIDSEMQLRALFDVDPSDPPFLAERLFEAFADLYAQDVGATIDFGIYFINAYSVTWAHRYHGQGEQSHFKFIPQFISWLKTSTAPLKVKTLMAHIVTSLPNPGFVYTSDYVQIFEWVDMQHWQGIMLPRYPLSQSFYRRVLSEGLHHDRNPKAHEFMKEVQVYYFLKELAKTETDNLENVIRTHSQTLIAQPHNTVRGLLELYKVNGVSLDRVLELLKLNNVIRVEFERIIKRKLKEASPLERHEMKTSAAYDPMEYTGFLVRVFPTYNAHSKAYYDTAGVLNKIAKLAADPICAERNLYKKFLIGGSLDLSQNNHLTTVVTYAAKLSEEYGKVVNASPDDKKGKALKSQLQRELKSVLVYFHDNMPQAIYSESINQLELNWITQMMTKTHVLDQELEFSIVRYLNARNRPEFRSLINEKLKRIQQLKRSGLADFDELERAYQNLLE